MQKTKVLAISSGGGHWAELVRIAPYLGLDSVVYVTVDASYKHDITPARLRVITDGSMWSKWRLLLMAAQIFIILAQERPDVLITTGAAPGYFAVRFARWFHCRTVWVDSIANVDELSLSGRKAGRYADLWLTQWPHLASPEGPSYAGAIL